MPTCEYCGEDFTKGGAYATHVKYCDDRPATEDRERSEAESEEGEEVTDEGIAIEISDGDVSSGPTQTDTDHEEIGGEHTSAGGTADTARATGFAETDDRAVGRWLAALVAIIVVAIVWRLLGRDED